MFSNMLWTAVFLGAIGVIAADFQLEILHTNDMHSRFFPTSKLSGVCSDKERKDNSCYGGFARVSEAVKLAKAHNANKKTLFLIAGDIYQGTIWYTVYKWRIVSELTNMLKPDAMSLGNHEFDDGVSGLVPFIDRADFPILATNLDISKEPELRRPNLKNSTIFTTNDGIKIAVIGYVTPETKFISQAEDVDFLDEVKSIDEEIARLKKLHYDLNVFIALGHSGYEMDKKIAAEVPDVDLVIGGHTNTFLYSGNPPPDDEVPEGLYPTWITQNSGRKVPVVQAYAYTKYLGQLHLEFDQNGEVKSAVGNPLLLDSKIGEDPFIKTELKRWEKNMTKLIDETVGTTKVFLDGDTKSCRLQECNLGNLITDAFVDYMAKLYKSDSKRGWTDTPIAIYNGGAVRSSIDSSTKNGNVTLREIMGVLPFVNNMVVMKLKGSVIMEALEWSVEDYSPSEHKGKFLQMSGLKVVYDLQRPNGKRVVKALARCGECRVPVYKPVIPKETYNVLTTIFTANGGDGYTMIKKQFRKEYEMDTTDTDMVKEYFLKRSPIYTGVEGRIKFVDHTESESGASVNSAFLFLTVLSSLICFIHA